jgi:sulfite exporter TauE/SafE
VFVSGILLGSGACLASCGPVFISYCIGTQKNIRKSLGSCCAFSVGRISIYILFALVIYFLGKLALEHFLGGSFKYVLIAGGSFIILVGLLMSLGKNIEFKFLGALQNKIIAKDTKSLFLMGIIVGILPCAPLFSILSYIGLVSKNWLSSLLYSLFFGLGTAISPLILLTVFAGIVSHLLCDRTAIYHRVFSIVCGMIIMLSGIHLIMRAIL